MTPFYTRAGDHGYTGLLGEGRFPKYHPRIEAIGAIDEANAALGMARAACQLPETAKVILDIQRDLYHLMAEIAATPENVHRFHSITAERIDWLETQIGDRSQLVEMPNEFIVPGDTPSGAALDLARTIIRRTERRVAELFHTGEIENIELLRYLNRLSSLCFVLELFENRNAGWERPTLASGESLP